MVQQNNRLVGDKNKKSHFFFFLGLAQNMPAQSDAAQKQAMKRFVVIMDSMTEHEIDNPKVLEKAPSRIERIARGSVTKFFTFEFHFLLLSSFSWFSF